MSEDILKLLNQRAREAAGGRRPDIEYVQATREVIAGHDLRESGNQAYGDNVYISTRNPPEVDRESLLTGELWRVGERESYEGYELRCERHGDVVTLRVFDREEQPVSRPLSCPAGEDDRYDEGLFTWFGPLEYIGTPWSDNDPEQCQVIAVEHLREFAEQCGARKLLEETAKRWAHTLEAALPEERYGDFDLSCAEFFEQQEQEWYQALIEAGASLNRRVCKTPSAYCEALLLSNAKAYIEMLLWIDDDEASPRDEAEEIARDYLSSNCEDHSFAAPMASLFLHLRQQASPEA